MNRKIIVLLIIASLVFLTGMREAASRLQYLTSFERTYPEAVGKKIDACILCHIENPNNGEDATNPYGMDYRRSGNFASIESLDSDKDGQSNIIEINNLSSPGNARDFPAGTTPVPASAVTTVEKTPGFVMLMGVFALMAIYRIKK